MKSRAFTSYGQALALNPQAFGMLVFEPPTPPESRDVGAGVHVVDVRGPLMHHADPFCDSYDAIKARVIGALEAGARSVVLAIDSPGGLVSGMLDTATEIRAACEARGARLIAYVDGQTTSAAYALACGAPEIYGPSTGIVGSIGVIDAVIDATAQDAAIGLKYSLVASGARKSDGNPHVPTTDATLVAAQARVDGLAAMFFQHVSSCRRISVDAVAALQAGIVNGMQANALGLTDGVLSLDQVLSLARAGGAGAVTAASQEGPTMDENEKAVRLALKAILDGDADEKAKGRAKAALAAMDDTEEPAASEEPSDEETPVAPPADEPDGDEAAKALAKAKAVEARLDAMERSAKAATASHERATLLASRPDLPEHLVKLCASASTPLAVVRDLVESHPRGPVRKPAATASVSGTRGDSQSGGGLRGAISTDPVMARAMGLASDDESGVVHRADVVKFNARRSAGNGGVR